MNFRPDINTVYQSWAGSHLVQIWSRGVNGAKVTKLTLKIRGKKNILGRSSHWMVWSTKHVTLARETMDHILSCTNSKHWFLSTMTVIFGNLKGDHTLPSNLNLPKLGQTLTKEATDQKPAIWVVLEELTRNRFVYNLQGNAASPRQPWLILTGPPGYPRAKAIIMLSTPL